MLTKLSAASLTKPNPERQLQILSSLVSATKICVFVYKVFLIVTPSKLRAFTPSQFPRNPQRTKERQPQYDKAEVRIRITDLSSNSMPDRPKELLETLVPVAVVVGGIPGGCMAQGHTVHTVLAVDTDRNLQGMDQILAGRRCHQLVAVLPDYSNCLVVDTDPADTGLVLCYSILDWPQLRRRYCYSTTGPRAVVRMGEVSGICCSSATCRDGLRKKISI